MKPLALAVCTGKTYSIIEEDFRDMMALNPAMDFLAVIVKNRLAVITIAKDYATAAAKALIPKDKPIVLVFATQRSFKNIDVELLNILAKNPDLFFIKMVSPDEKTVREILERFQNDLPDEKPWRLN